MGYDNIVEVFMYKNVIKYKYIISVLRLFSIEILGILGKLMFLLYLEMGIQNINVMVIALVYYFWVSEKNKLSKQTALLQVQSVSPNPQHTIK